MKRVLNSGTIKLPQVKDSEKELLANCAAAYGENESLIPYAIATNVFAHIEFTFEIKAPLLTFLAFQDAHLGTLNRLDELDHPIAYLPPQFYKKDGLTYTSMDSKACN